MPEQELKRRLPAIGKPISEIRPDKDIRVRILGTIIDASESSLLIDDGTSKLEILFDDPNLMAGLSTGQLVRVVTRILPLIDGYEARGECVQNLDGFNIEQYRKVKGVME